MTLRYIDRTSGLDGNSGLSPAAAWQTLSKITSAGLVPGDQVLLKRGEIWYEVIQPSSNGAADNHIVISSYGVGNQPIIDGTTPVTGWTNSATNIYWAALSGATEALMAWDADDTFLEDRKTSLAGLVDYGDWFHDRIPNRLYVFRASEPTTVYASQRDGADIISLSYITLHDLHFRRCQLSAIDIFSSFANVSFTTVEDCSHHGIQYQNSSTGTIDSVTVSNPGLRMGDGACIHAVTGSAVTLVNSTFSVDRSYSAGTIEGVRIESNFGAASHMTISLNTFLNFPNSGISGFTNNGGFISATRNRIVNCAENGIELSSYGDASFVTLAYNLIYNTGVGLEGSTGGIELEGGEGILLAEQGIGIELKAASIGAHIYNNLLSGNSKAIRIEDDCTGAIVKNNIGVNSQGIEFEIEPGAQAGADIDYNDFWDESGTIWRFNGVDYTDLATYRAASGFEVHGISADPLFQDEGAMDFRLSDQSPALGIGANVGLALDYAGTPIEPPIEIGAFEFLEIVDGDQVGSPAIVYNGKIIFLPTYPSEFRVSPVPPRTVNYSLNGDVETILQPRLELEVYVSFPPIESRPLRAAIDNWWQWAVRGNSWLFMFDHTRDVNTTLALPAVAGATTLFIARIDDIRVDGVYALCKRNLYQLVKVATIDIGTFTVTLVNSLDYDFPTGSVFRDQFLWEGCVVESEAKSPIKDLVLHPRELFELNLEFYQAGQTTGP